METAFNRRVKVICMLASIFLLAACGEEETLTITEQQEVKNDLVGTTQNTTHSFRFESVGDPFSGGDLPTPVPSDFNLETCTDDGMADIAGTIDVGLDVAIFDEEGRLVEPSGVQYLANIHGEFEARNLPNGNYYLVTFEGPDERIDFVLDGIDVPKSDPVLVTLDCPENFNRSPILEVDYGIARVGESDIIDVLANDFDPNGDELILSGVLQAANGIVEIVDERHVKVTRTGEGWIYAYYNVEDGRGGHSQSYIFFSSLAPRF